MSKDKIDVYIVGDGRKPDWLDSESAGGRIRMVYDDGELLHASVSTVGGVKKAKAGDVIVKQKSGLSVLTAEQARKYKLIPVVKKSEVKKDEEVE